MSVTQNVERDLKKYAIIRGLLLGIIVLALSLFSFYFITRLSNDPLLILTVMFSCSTLLPIIAAILFALDMRRKIGGHWGLRQAITGIFLMLLVSFVILTIGRDFIFSKLIEPDMADKVKIVMIGVKTNRLEAQHAPPGVIKSQIAELNKELTPPANITLLDMLNDYLKTIVLLFAIAVIFAAILKKDPPQIANDIIE